MRGECQPRREFPRAAKDAMRRPVVTVDVLEQQRLGGYGRYCRGDGLLHVQSTRRESSPESYVFDATSVRGFRNYWSYQLASL